MRTNTGIAHLKVRYEGRKLLVNLTYTYVLYIILTCLFYPTKVYIFTYSVTKRKQNTCSSVETYTLPVVEV